MTKVQELMDELRSETNLPVEVRLTGRFATLAGDWLDLEDKPVTILLDSFTTLTDAGEVRFYAVNDFQVTLKSGSARRDFTVWPIRWRGQIRSWETMF